MLVDQVNVERGQPTLGWMNPLLYSLAATDYEAGGPFLDVQLGTNTVFDGITDYPATPGYDFASGLGSLFADRLAAALGDPSAPSSGVALAATPSPTEPRTVQLAADPAVPGGVVTAYGWDFDGDGSVDQVTTAPTVTHTYDVAGGYLARVTVKTSLARSASFSTTLVALDLPTVTPTGVAPVFTG